MHRSARIARSAGHPARRSRSAAATGAVARQRVGASVGSVPDLLALHRQVGNRTISRVLAGGRKATLALRDPAAPPKRPPVLGKRSEGQQWIPDRSVGRKPPTFAQIYLAVRDAQFDSVFDGDLKRLDLGQLQTLDNVTARQFEFFANLARQEAADPGFVPPEGTPDVIFRNAAKEMRKFREGRLALALTKSERRHKAPELIEPWAQLMWDKYGGEPFGEAVEAALPAVKMVVEAGLSGSAFEFSDAGIARYGYISYEGARELCAAALPKGLTKADAPAYMRDEMLAKMRDLKSNLAVEIADAYLTAGSGDVAEPASFLSVIALIRNELLRAIEYLQQQRVGTALFVEENPDPPPNLIYDALELRAKDKTSIYGPFENYLARGNEDQLTGWARDAGEALGF